MTVHTSAVARFEHQRLLQQRRRYARTFLFGSLFLLAVAGSAHVGEVSVQAFVEGLPGIFNYIHDTLPTLRQDHLREDLAEWFWALPRWLGLLLDTILIAFIATLLGSVGAFALCFGASRNLVTSSWIYFTARRVLELARSVPELVYALIFVFAFGLGPLPGVLAIAVHTVGALGKLFSEVNENIDDKPMDGVRSAGGSWLQVIRFAVIPQVLPNYVSYALLRFEINVRSASVIGFVGAGGIGQELMFVIRQFIYTEISALLILIVLTVTLIDIASGLLRRQLIGREAMT